MKRSYPVFGSIAVLVAAILVAALLPHECSEKLIRHLPRCMGAGISLRVGIVFAGLAVAGLLILFARRTSN